jgi:hypothetical protein
LQRIDPQTSKFLTEPERDAMLDDLPEQAPSMKEKTFKLEQVKEMIRTPSFVPFTLIWICHGIGGFGIAFVLPTIIFQLGITNTALSQIMTMVGSPDL